MLPQEGLFKSIAQYFPLLTSSLTETTTSDLQTSIKEGFTSTIRKVSEIRTNLLYNIKHSDLPVPLLHRKQITIRNDHSTAWLLGRQYNFDSFYRMEYQFRHVFWFSYRSGIKEIQSDNGWGCMIRTVQMVMAQTLKRSWGIDSNDQAQKLKVIGHFRENNNGDLSLSKICQEGNIVKRWTSSLQVLTVFSKIIARYPQVYNISMEIYSSGMVFDCPKKYLVKKYPVMLSLSNRVSVCSIPQQLHAHYFAMMRHSSYVGTIGGVKGQALYIIGSYDDKVIFLDPHFVRSTQQDMQLQSYFCDKARGLQIKALSPSLSVCYYIQNEKAHLSWMEWLDGLSQKYYPNLVFEFMSKERKQRCQQRQRTKQQKYGGIQKEKESQHKERVEHEGSWDMNEDMQIYQQRQGQIVLVNAKKQQEEVGSVQMLIPGQNELQDLGGGSDDSMDFQILQ